MARATRLSRADFPTRPPRVRASNELFSVALWSLKHGLEPKFACVVSKKVAAKATDRNRLKRQCREIASPPPPTINGPVAVVIYPKRAALGVPFANLKQSLRALLAKSGGGGYNREQ